MGVESSRLCIGKRQGPRPLLSPEPKPSQRPCPIRSRSRTLPRLEVHDATDSLSSGLLGRLRRPSVATIHVTLSTATPRGGAYSRNDSGFPTLDSRPARETRAPQFARFLLHFERRHCGAGVPPAGCLPLSVTIFIEPATRPSTPAFWGAVTLWRPAAPASHHRRGHSWVD